METIMVISILLFLVSLIAVIITSRNSKMGKMTPLKFRHIQGMPNLMNGEIITISSDKESIKIDNKYVIPKYKLTSKSITTSKLLTDKQKSVIKRSLAGIAVGGALGGIIGGLSGVGSKQVIEEIHFLTLDFKDDNGERHNALFALEEVSHLMYLNMFVKS